LVLTALLMAVHFGVTRFPSTQESHFEDPEFLDSISQIFTAFQYSTPLKSKAIRPFDPNTVDYDSLITWGLEPFIATNMIKYRAAGGRFIQTEDLKKLFGMTDSIWQALSPWIDLNSIQTESKQIKSNVNEQTAQRPYLPKNAHRNIPRKDLNEVDSVWLKSIHGIGPVLSKRLVKYRKLLGGFNSMDQLNEVYGLSPDVLANLSEKLFIQPDAYLSKINLNIEDYKRIASHPYMSFNQAKAIIAYRNQHGSFKSVEELKNIHLIDDSTYLRAYPYLDF